VKSVNKATALQRALATGIIPVIRAASAEDALFAAEAVFAGGVDVVEITMTVPGATAVVSRIVEMMPRFWSVPGRFSMLTRPSAVWTPERSFS